MAAGAPHSIQGILTSSSRHSQATSTATANLELKNNSLSYLWIIHELAPVLNGKQRRKEIFNVSETDFEKMQNEKGMKSLR